MLKNLIQNFRTAWKLPRWRWALLAALVSDAIGFGVVLIPPVQWAFDVVTAGVLLGVLGFRWSLLGALAIEVVPVLELFPAWTLVVVALASAETQPRPVKTATPGTAGRLGPTLADSLTPEGRQNQGGT
jgi:hypothetical protein